MLWAIGARFAQSVTRLAAGGMGVPAGKLVRLGARVKYHLAWAARIALQWAGDAHFIGTSGV